MKCDGSGERGENQNGLVSESESLYLEMAWCILEIGELGTYKVYEEIIILITCY